MGRSPKIITAALFVSVLLGALDTGVVVPALTAIIQQWSVSYQWGIWVITLYLLMFVMSVPAVKTLSNYFGRQFMLSVCLALFGIGALVSGFSPNFPTLLIGRLLQGVGGGGLLTLASVVLGRRGVIRRIGLISVPLAAAAILAFLLGSVLVTALHWRWVFYVQIPPAFLAFVLIMCKPGKPAVSRKPFDGIGLLLLTSIIICAMLGFTSLRPEQFWTSLLSSDVLPFIVVAVGLVIPFIMVERQHDVPLIPLHVFYRQHIVFISLISLFSGVSWVALLFIPAFAENALRLEPGAGGYMLSILAIVVVVSVALSRLTTERYGARLTVTAGFFLVACGFLMLGTLVSQFWGFVFAVSLVGLGLGATIGVPFKRVLSRHVDQAVAAGVLSVIQYFRVVGMTVGPAVLVTFLTQATEKIPEKVRDSLVFTSPSAKEVSGGIFADLLTGSAQFTFPDAAKLRELIPDHIAVSTQELILRQIMRVMRGTLTEGYQDVFIAATVFALIGFVCALVVLRHEQNERGA